MPIEITAAGIDAETVSPTRKPRYAFAALKMIARIAPVTIEVTVISGSFLSAGIKGLKSYYSISPPVKSQRIYYMVTQNFIFGEKYN